MKTFKLFSILCFALTLSVSAQKFKTPVEYLDFIGKEQKTISKNMWKYTQAVAHSKSDRNIDNKRKTIIKSIERAITKIKKAQGFDGDTYKNQVLEYLHFNKNLMNADYAKIIDMKAVAEQSYDAMEAYMLTRKMADEKMAESQANYESNFNLFAAKHNINIIESESDLSKKMEISNAVFEDYNNMYLIFFKVYINEVYLWEAVERKDVAAMQQNSNSLNQAAKEALEIIKTVENYKDDKSVVKATKEVLDFFIDESENKIPVLIDFFVLNENMNKITETLEKTPERKRTKKQIDNYNKKVKEINKAVKNYNKINTELNNNRQKALNNLNLANDNFLARHIPKD